MKFVIFVVEFLVTLNLFRCKIKTGGRFWSTNCFSCDVSPQLLQFAYKLSITLKDLRQSDISYVFCNSFWQSWMEICSVELISIVEGELLISSSQTKWGTHSI